MQAVVKTPHIKFQVKGNIPKWLIDALKRKYSKKVSIVDEENEAIDIFKSDWYKKAKKKVTPGYSLKTYRVNNNLTQAQLAKQIDETPQHISDMENDRRSISKKNALTFSKIFKTSLEHFIK